MPRSLQGRTDVDDIVQDTLVRALAFAAKTPSEPLTRDAFLYTILRNRIRDEMRALRSSPTCVELPENLVAREALPIQVVMNRQLVSRYRRALRRLPGDMRRAVTLRVEDGVSYRGVAQRIGCSSSDSARMLVSRGRRRLTLLLEAAAHHQARRNRRPKR